MSFFGKILEKLGFKMAKAEPAPAPKAPAPRVAPAPSAPPPPPPPKPIEVVDVVAQLEKLAAANPQKLNWKVSIVDLLKLLDIDSSFAARKELATELGCPAELMGDSARMNMWLHKTVLKKIADNGGNVPKELLD
jgi:3-oxoacyl-ACP reductase-like protein